MSNDSLEPLSPAEATAIIHEITRKGEIILSSHCRNESMPKRNIDFQDILTVLLNGLVRRPPEFDEKHRQFKYRVEGVTVDEEETVVITVIMSLKSIFVVTVY